MSIAGAAKACFVIYWQAENLCLFIRKETAHVEHVIPTTASRATVDRVETLRLWFGCARRSLVSSLAADIQCCQRAAVEFLAGLLRDVVGVLFGVRCCQCRRCTQVCVLVGL
jgi:hypothetical protein